MRKHLPIAIALALAAANAQAAVPAWFEPDSVEAVARRTRADFPYTVDEFYEIVKKDNPDFTRTLLDTMIARKYVETLPFDGTTRVFKKSLRNMRLLDPATSGFTHRGATASPQRISYVDSILQYSKGKNPVGGAHRVIYRFAVDIPNHDFIQGDTLRVWLPVPRETQRQTNVRILGASDDYVLSGNRSEHSSIYFTKPVGAPGDTTHFEYVAQFDTHGEYFSPDYIMANIKPYRHDDNYRRYTAVEPPHVIPMEKLAYSIVGDERNPFKMSELVYDYIINNYPWAGAREYSTIPCIPAYVVEEGHGDCGQVSLLYISLMRSLGVPARWESGWMLHPGEVNLHDWAEVYFEGVGWVPVDASFGRYTSSPNPEVQHFYSHGMDSWRLAANKAVGKPFYPEKKYIRSETVDAQLGEVETTQGNLFYPGWQRHFEVLHTTPIE